MYLQHPGGNGGSSSDASGLSVDVDAVTITILNFDRPHYPFCKDQAGDCQRLMRPSAKSIRRDANDHDQANV